MFILKQRLELPFEAESVYKWPSDATYTEQFVRAGNHALVRGRSGASLTPESGVPRLSTGL